MPRTEVYQLRLTKTEKALLARWAEERGVPIAVLIRKTLGLHLPQPPGRGTDAQN